MTCVALDQAHVRHLNVALRALLTAVNQYFIHILLLRSWGDKELAQEITPVNNADVCSVMRLVDALLDTRSPTVLCAERAPFGTHLPIIGASHAGILDADLALERRLLETLSAAERGLAACGDPRVKQTIADALSRRPSHGAWLEQKRRCCVTDKDPTGSPPSTATDDLNGLLGQLVAHMEQALVHAFVVWHTGEKELADCMWTASFAAMMHSTSIIDYFGARTFAPCLERAVTDARLQGPRVGRTVAEAIAFEGAIASLCADRAKTAALRHAADPAGAMCERMAADLERLADWTKRGRTRAEGFPFAIHRFEPVRAKRMM